MTDSPGLFTYDQVAFEALCSELVRAGFSPTGDDQSSWVGQTPASLSDLTDATSMFVSIPVGWPLRAARLRVPGLVADHVLPSGYICLWADDDPAQSMAITFSALLERLDEWAIHARSGFRPEDRALDSFVLFPGRASLRAELDVPQLIGRAVDGIIRSAYAKAGPIVTLKQKTDAEYQLQGVVYYRDRIRSAPRSFNEFRACLTRRQRDNLAHGLSQRRDAAENEKSGGYDFAVLVWPRYGLHDAIMLTFAGSGDQLVASPNELAPSDIESRRRRAGRQAPTLARKNVLVAGAGAIGGQVALALASSGVGRMTIHDGDQLESVNLARHVCDHYAVGYPKSLGVSLRISSAAPWCRVATESFLPDFPDDLAESIAGFDLVIDCTGIYFTTIALAHACGERGIPFVSASLYQGGSIARTRRQSRDDVPLLHRHASTGFLDMPAETAGDFDGFLELGCTSPVHNAPPVSVLKAASDATGMCLDILTATNFFPQEVLSVIAPLSPPFDKVGTISLPLPPS
ncbi:ThiF family adenylyltransferase [Agrococcus sediminis]|uniref:ThiF family adenylyltransferase n=1 Tax=Agrococcus sediminis TaxID=2599924 RepID=UPI003420D77C